MEIRKEQLVVSDSIGSVSIEIYEPSSPRVMMTLAHGAGAGMGHRFMVALSSALAAENIGTMRFNFPYMEQGKKRPDMPVVAEKTVGAILKKLSSTYPSIPLFASGKSFGGRMTSNFLSKNKADDIRGIIFYGFPLHPAGNPGITRAEHLNHVDLPMLFLQGTKDTLAETNLIQGVCGKLKNATLDLIDGADHGFIISRKERIDILVERSVKWIDTLKSS